MISSAEADALIVVSAAGEALLSEESIANLKEIPGVSTVEKYLVTKIGKYDVIGMEPGTRGLILAKNSLIGIKVRLGRWFEAQEDHAVVIGKVYMEDFGEGPPVRGMKHAYSIGSVIRLGERKIPVRVIGVYISSNPDADAKIFVPLIKAQQWFDKPQRISYAVISLTGAASPEEIITAMRQKLPPDASIKALSRSKIGAPTPTR